MGLEKEAKKVYKIDFAEGDKVTVKKAEYLKAFKELFKLFSVKKVWRKLKFICLETEKPLMIS